MLKLGFAFALVATAFTTQAAARTIVLPTATTTDYILSGGPRAGTAGRPATLVSFDIFSPVDATTVVTRFVETSPGINVRATFSNIVVELGDSFLGVSEPATWLSMVAGFGLLGAAARRPRRRLARS